jgi:hypothetical protein
MLLTNLRTFFPHYVKRVEISSIVKFDVTAITVYSKCKQNYLVIQYIRLQGKSVNQMSYSYMYVKLLFALYIKRPTLAPVYDRRW